MTARSLSLVLSLLLPVLAGCANVTDRMVTGVERGAERAAEREAARQADQAVTGVMRGAETAIVCVVTDTECIENARRNGQAVEVRDQDGNVVETYPAPSDGVNVNYDFRAGERVLFYEDFSSDPIGNFPRSLEFVQGNWEIAEWQGRRLLRNTGPSGSALRVVLPEVLPQNFSIETEVYLAHSNNRFVLMTRAPEVNWNQVDFNFFQVGYDTGVLANRNVGLSSSTNRDPRLNEGLIPVRIMVEGDYAKVYVGTNRTANIPNSYIPRSEVLRLEIVHSTEDRPVYLGPIRIAAL